MSELPLKALCDLHSRSVQEGPAVPLREVCSALAFPAVLETQWSIPVATLSWMSQTISAMMFARSAVQVGPARAAGRELLLSAACHWPEVVLAEH